MGSSKQDPAADIRWVMPQPAVRPSLRLVKPDTHGSAWFCGRCGERHTDQALVPRVCPACELGLLLQTSTEAAPERGDAFLIIDSSLAVQAVSAEAEVMLGVREKHAVNRHVTELLIPGDTDPAAAGSLAVAITRIATCGPPLAALLVLDQPTGVN
jgi:hypothetical protein